jgi:RNA polymerase sigma-70 factor (ECF subfamily)
VLGEADVRAFLSSDYPRLVAGLALVLGGRGAAEDAVQEALARAWERTTRGESIESLPDWVAVVAMNLLRSRLRRLRSEVRAMERLGSRSSVGADPPSTFDRSEERVDLARALRMLPRRQREAVVLHYFAGLGVAEIGAALRVREGAAKSLLHRARASLAAELGRSYREGDLDV